MKTALDTNILSSLWSRELTSSAVAAALGEAGQRGALVISGFVFAEAHAHPRASTAFVTSFLSSTGIVLDPLPPVTELFFLAGERFRAFAERRRLRPETPPRRILADFLIGAHAVLHADYLLTLDTRFYSTNFPELALLTLPS